MFLCANRDNGTLFIAALFTIAKVWNQPRYPSNDEWIKKTYITEHYIVTKKNGILLFSGKWIELAIILLTK
jgi:hypothetical protein